MSRTTDIQPAGATLYFLPVQTRVPLKFGTETLTSVTCARVRMDVEDRSGRRAVGWGETPLSVQWVWPSRLSYQRRHEVMKSFCVRLTGAWESFLHRGHPMEVGHGFQENALPLLLEQHNADRPGEEPMPHLAALVCCSAFDLALHDAFGVLHDVRTYDTYNADWMNRDLADYFGETDYTDPLSGGPNSLRGKYPQDFFTASKTQLPAWHLVGGLDPLTEEQLTGDEPRDGYPVLLRDWIRTDGLTCLKIKLRGNDSAWDYQRLLDVGRISIEEGVQWLTADFNCTVTAPQYVVEILNRLRDEEPRVYGMILYVEQPFPYDLEAHRIAVHAVSAEKPLFMDESAHDWKLVKLGRSLGWTGVALKTCKTQTGAILSACWAKAHGMTLMVQDLTNPMLAQIPHVLLAAHVGTIMGVETNAMQFYPEASNAEAAVHPGLYRRRQGRVGLSSLNGPGFGYRVAEIGRALPAPAAEAAR